MAIQRLSNRKTYSIILIIIILIIAIYAIKTYRHKTVNLTPHKSITTVSTSPIKYYTIPQTTLSYGTTVSPTSVLLTAQIDAIVKAIDFKPGQKVKKGQRLFTLKVTDITGQPATLKAIMETSKSDYDRKRQENMQIKGSIAPSILLTAKLLYEQNLATYKQAKALQQIRAPIDGTISDTDLKIGSFVQSGNSLAHVIAPSSLQLRTLVESLQVEILLGL